MTSNDPRPPHHAPRQQRRIEGPVTSPAAPGPWLSIRSKLDRLEADLKGRGFQVWHRRDAAVVLTAPDGQQLPIGEDLRAAYETAREYANAQAWDEVSA